MVATDYYFNSKQVQIIIYLYSHAVLSYDTFALNYDTFVPLRQQKLQPNGRPSKLQIAEVRESTPYACDYLCAVLLAVH